ncbi:hypothetical protein [Flavobacterium noncentrifugens]|uniref:hypothetical protein n=1 Tax=Flavobacterium noncentrifugens TaxID=1128970 RepID=UPI0011138FCC|nr:hypothetical protein [Flavobacterium noncentrifugens]
MKTITQIQPNQYRTKISALTTQKTVAEQSLLLIKTTEIPLTNSRGTRKTLFELLQPLSTNSSNAQSFRSSRNQHQNCRSAQHPGKTRIKGSSENKRETPTISASQ